MNKYLKIVLALTLILLLTAGTYGSYVHKDGPNKMVYESGGELEAQSGAVVDFQDGTTFGVNDISENSLAHGVVVDSVTLKDGGATFTGSLLDSDSALTVADNAMVDGAADAVQLTVQGYTTQTADIFVVETSAGTDLVTTDVTNTTFAQGVVVSTGGLSLSDGDLTVADDLKIAAQTSITVTNGAAFTPTGTYQAVAAAGWVTPTITMGSAGQLLMLTNTSAVSVSIQDTGTTMLSAQWDGGQYDTLTLLCDGTNWLEISRSDN